MKSKHLGYNVVVYGGSSKYLTIAIKTMEILQSSSSDDGAAFPAQSITLSNEEQITALRDFCDEILKEEKVQLKDI
jgi:hypothetical protein